MRYHDFKEEYFTDISLSKNKETTGKYRKEIQPQIDEVNSIKVKMTKKDLENSCIELVTVNGRPFSILNDWFPKYYKSNQIGNRR